MTNKYAIYCDSLEDEQLLKDWIKKESDLEGYNDYNYRKLYFHFPANDYLGFQQNFHLYDVCLAKDGYIKINIKDFLKEYYMKELTELPKSWAVKCDGSQLFEDTVIKYLDFNYTPQKKAYYGFDKHGKVNWYFHNIDNYFDTILTLDEFIKLTTKNMKTELLGLPIIRGEKHHLEAFAKDCEKFGYNAYISKESDVLVYNNRDVSEILKSERSFKTLFVGPKSYAGYSDTNLPIKEFQLPQDWSKALDFMKENMDRWNKIQEESKQPKFEVGDIVLADGNLSMYKNSIGKIIGIENSYTNPYCISFQQNINTRIWSNVIRFATTEEVETYNNKSKIFKMTSSTGDFELEVSKKGIFYKPETAWLNPSDIEQIVKSFRLNCGSLNTSVNQSSYSVDYETVKVGCKSGTSIKQWKEVYDYYKSIS